MDQVELLAGDQIDLVVLEDDRSESTIASWLVPTRDAWPSAEPQDVKPPAPAPPTDVKPEQPEGSEAAEALYSGAALPIPASANGSDWPGGRLALTGGDGGMESQGLLGETRTLLDEVDGLYRAELPGLSTVIDLPAGGRRDVLREIVFSSAYTATLLAGAAGDYDEEGAQLCGAITVQLHARERYAEILTCAVARPWRGLGVARLLVAWIERLAHSASLRFLLVAAGTDVLKFWHRLGYTDVVPDDVPAPWVDELHAKFEGSQVMHRALPQAQAAADGVRDAIGQLQQAATKRRRR